jgi:hypothetical protein
MVYLRRLDKARFRRLWEKVKVNSDANVKRFMIEAL